MATDEGMMESDEYQDWIDRYGEEEPRKTGGSKRHNHQQAKCKTAHEWGWWLRPVVE